MTKLSLSIGEEVSVVNCFTISVGSNTRRGASAVSEALDFLESRLERVCRSSVYSTPSVSGDGTTYFNAVARGYSHLSLEEMEAVCKDYEAKCGRVRGSKDVEIDLDVVVFNSCVVRPRDAERAYFTIGVSQLP